MGIISSTARRGAGAIKGMKGKGVVGTGAFFGVDAAMNMAGGDDIGTAAIKSAGTSLLFASNPALMSALTIAPTAVQGVMGFQRGMQEKKDYWNSQMAGSNVVGGNFQDSQRAQTMRQAGVQAIQGSKLNARSALGGEAKLLNPYASRKF